MQPQGYFSLVAMLNFLEKTAIFATNEIFRYHNGCYCNGIKLYPLYGWCLCYDYQFSYDRKFNI